METFDHQVRVVDDDDEGTLEEVCRQMGDDGYALVAVLRGSGGLVRLFFRRSNGPARRGQG